MILGHIGARKGSKGVPRKNIKLLNGMPLIGHAIEVARACPSLGEVIVSTDDEEIAEVARELGAHVPFLRPAALATDTASEWRRNGRTQAFDRRPAWFLRGRRSRGCLGPGRRR